MQESQNNKRYESDLTRQERVREKWQMICSLHGKKRMEYLWQYYRFVLYIAAAVLLVAISVMVMIGNKRKITVLSVVVTDADRESTEKFEELERSLLAYLGSGNTREQILVDTAATSNQDDESVMNLTMKMSIAEENDVVICNEDVYNRFHEQNAFADWSEILGEDSSEFADVTDGDRILLSQSIRWKDGNYVQYEPAYICVLNNSKKKETAKEFIKYFFEK